MLIIFIFRTYQPGSAPTEKNGFMIQG